MRELLKTDLKRILKDKLFLVACILGVIFAVSSPLLSEALIVGLNIEEELGASFASAKTMFFSSFSISGNFGLILPILISIVLCKDFSHGTIRNKIICGKTRTSIFFSMFISGTIIICGLMLAHALLTLVVSLLFFPYQAEAFTINSFGYLLVSILFSVLLYVFISSLISFLSVCMKTTGLAVVIYIAINFFFSIIGTVIALVTMFVKQSDTSAKILEILQKVNLFTASHIGTGTSYSLSDVLCTLLPIIIGSTVCLFLGNYIFKKKDIK